MMEDNKRPWAVREGPRKSCRPGIVGKAVLGVFILVLLSGLTGCDPGAGITWVNDTDQEVHIYSGDDLNDFDTSVPARSSETLGYNEADWLGIVVVRDKQGDVLLRQEITWNEFKEQGFRFVITQDMLAPTPTPGP